MNRLFMILFSVSFGLILGGVIVLSPGSLATSQGGFIGRLLDKPSDVIKAQTELERLKLGHIEKMKILDSALNRVPGVAWAGLSLLFSLCLLFAYVAYTEKKRADHMAIRINQLLIDLGADRKATFGLSKSLSFSGKEIMRHEHI